MRAFATGTYSTRGRHGHTRAHTQTCTHVQCTRTYMHAHMLVHTCTHTNTYPCIPTWMQMHTHICLHTSLGRCTQTVTAISRVWIVYGFDFPWAAYWSFLK